MSDEFVYRAEAVTDDGESHVLDLEEHGWADKALLARTVRWSIVPKVAGWPIVVVHIPKGGKPIFKSRVFRKMSMSEDGVAVGFRCYGIGYFLRGKSYWTWALPNGAIEVGEDLYLADLLLRSL
jgi:hypothetical protein